MLLLWKINRFCRRTGMSPTTFGRLAVKDPRLVADLRRGREVGSRVARRVESFIEGAQA